MLGRFGKILGLRSRRVTSQAEEFLELFTRASLALGIQPWNSLGALARMRIRPNRHFHHNLFTFK